MDLVRSWWNWCTESFGHMFLGVTAPLLLLGAVVVILTASKSADLPQPPRSDVAGVCLGASTASPAACASPAGTTGALAIDTATPVPPTPTPSPRTYEVQPGDTLSTICANEVPDMAVQACIAQVVSMSKLSGPDQIAAGQTLSLPGQADPNATPRPRPTATPALAPEPEPEDPEPEDEDVSEVVEDDEDAAGGDEAVDEEADGEAEGEDSGTDETSEDGPEPQGTPEALLIPLLAPTDPDDTQDTETDLEPEPTATTELDIQGATLYTVQEGDNLLSICAEQVPDMSVPECATFVVLLNDLDGPDEIYANQGLLLP